MRTLVKIKFWTDNNDILFFKRSTNDFSKINLAKSLISSLYTTSKKKEIKLATNTSANLLYSYCLAYAK